MISRAIALQLLNAASVINGDICKLLRENLENRKLRISQARLAQIDLKP